MAATSATGRDDEQRSVPGHGTNGVVLWLAHAADPMLHAVTGVRRANPRLPVVVRRPLGSESTQRDTGDSTLTGVVWTRTSVVVLCCVRDVVPPRDVPDLDLS